MQSESSHEGLPPRPAVSQETLDVLTRGEMGDCHLTPDGSNYAFFTTIADDSSRQYRVVYKPRKGEAPLWDFPDGTLYIREYAAYLLSEALGWRFVPPTVIREGVYGVGSVQLFVDSNPQANYFTLREAYLKECLRICTFDVIANNADRKASHCILDTEGCVWAIDHGIAFHSEPKLRTVIWDFAGDPVPEWIVTDLRRLQEQFDATGGLGEQLNALMDPREVQACRHRLDDLLAHPVFPAPGLERAVPWPWI